MRGLDYRKLEQKIRKVLTSLPQMNLLMWNESLPTDRRDELTKIGILLLSFPGSIITHLCICGAGDCTWFSCGLDDVLMAQYLTKRSVFCVFIPSNVPFCIKLDYSLFEGKGGLKDGLELHGSLT